MRGIFLRLSSNYIRNNDINGSIIEVVKSALCVPFAQDGIGYVTNNGRFYWHIILMPYGRSSKPSTWIDVYINKRNINRYIHGRSFAISVLVPTDYDKIYLCVSGLDDDVVFLTRNQYNHY